MRVIVFGATGKTGQHVLRAALDADHHVTAFGRSVERLDIDDPALQVHKGDVFDSGAVESAVQGHDGAIVCLGSTGLRDKTTLSVGTKSIIDASVAHDVQRLVVMSAAGVGESWQQIPRSSRFLFRTMLRNVFADHESKKPSWRPARSTGPSCEPLSSRTTRRPVTTPPPTQGPSPGSPEQTRALVDQLTDTTYSRQPISVTN